MSAICNNCIYSESCKSGCNALKALYSIYNAQRTEEKRALIKVLREQLSLEDAFPSDELRELGEKVINKFPELHFIKDCGIKVGYVISYEKKQSGKKLVNATCTKLDLKYKAYLPYDYLITFYDYNTELLNDNQKKIVMLHELTHISEGERGLTIRKHDKEDFSYILETYGIRWNEYGNNDVPDILGGE